MKSQTKKPVNNLQGLKKALLRLIHSKEVDKYLQEIKEIKLDLPVKN